MGDGLSSPWGPFGATPAECGHQADMFKAPLVVSHSINANVASELKGDAPEIISFWSTLPGDKVLIDSGASHVISPRRDKMFGYQPAQIKINLASHGHSSSASGTGGLLLALHGQYGITELEIPPPTVIHNASSHSTLVPTTLLQKLGIEVLFPADTNQCVLTKNGRVLCIGYHREGKLYEMPITILQPPVTVNNAEAKIGQADLDLAILHLRLAHLNEKETLVFAKTGKATQGIEKAKDADSFFCAGCQLGKASRLPFSSAPREKVTQLGGKVHIDIWGPARVAGLNGERYMMALIDEASNEAMVYFMRNREQSYRFIQAYKVFMEKQYGPRFKLQVLRSDNAGEILKSNEMMMWMEQNGIKEEEAPPHTPELNSIAERYWRTIVDPSRAILITGNLPMMLWPEIVRAVVYIKNRLPSRAIGGRVPFEVLTKKKAYLNHLRVLGCDAYA